MNKIVNGVKESVFEYFVISAGMLYELIFLMLTCYILLYFQYYEQHVLSGFFRSAPSKEEVYVVVLESKDTKIILENGWNSKQMITKAKLLFRWRRL